jgi:hypothetical protein
MHMKSDTGAQSYGVEFFADSGQFGLPPNLSSRLVQYLFMGYFLQAEALLCCNSSGLSY